jgi:hypothetical protein
MADIDQRAAFGESHDTDRQSPSSAGATRRMPGSDAQVC